MNAADFAAMRAAIRLEAHRSRLDAAYWQQLARLERLLTVETQREGIDRHAQRHSREGANR